jgi:hypothetical protein
MLSLAFNDVTEGVTVMVGVIPVTVTVKGVEEADW